jgi:hypothetical protein
MLVQDVLSGHGTRDTDTVGCSSKPGRIVCEIVPNLLLKVISSLQSHLSFTDRTRVKPTKVHQLPSGNRLPLMRKLRSDHSKAASPASTRDGCRTSTRPRARESARAVLQQSRVSSRARSGTIGALAPSARRSESHHCLSSRVHCSPTGTLSEMIGWRGRINPGSWRRSRARENRAGPVTYGF